MSEKFHFIQEVSENPLYGKLATVILPSGSTVTIREQNGDDDEIISSFITGNDPVGPINRFVAALVLKHNYKFSDKSDVLTPKEVLNIPLRDKYFILMTSRIFSISDNIKFNWDWQNGRPEVPYEEDLLQYMWDYNKEFPYQGDIDYFKHRIQPYPENQACIEVNLSSGKKVRYYLLDGHGESYIMGLADSDKSINTPIRARRLEIFDNGNWMKVESFKVFKSYEMAELRDSINTYDKPFDGLTDLHNPYTNETVSIPLLAIPDFFFPREI
jgi:hypothetical protein